MRVQNKRKERKTIDDYIPCIYYDVPRCPVCGSACTGYYKKRIENNVGWLTKEGLKHGEIIRETTEVTQDNAFCEECGFEWEQDIHASIISKARKLEIMKEKGLIDRFDSLVQSDNQNSMEYKKQHPVLWYLKQNFIRRV